MTGGDKSHHGTEVTISSTVVGGADSAVRYFDDDLALSRLLELDFFQVVLSTRFRDDDGLVSFGKRHSVRRCVQ